MSSVQQPDSSTPVKGLDDVRLRTVKASLSSQSTSMAVRAVVKNALIRHYGSLKAAAISLEMDLGQLSRELDNGDFKLLKRMDGEAHADARRFVIEAMRDAEGPADPKTRARRLIRDTRAMLDELAEVVA